MNDAAGELAGLTQEEAAKRVLEWAAERGQLEKREHYRHSVGHCERCHSRIEPLVMLQWWLAMEELAAPAIAAVKEGRVRFTPERFARVYLDWMENVRDWCISRQIWWGHRIPVWYCPDGHVTVAETEPDACAECGSAELRQDEDVLDTWFSSALYPFATLGWPDETPELARYYPGSVAHDGARHHLPLGRADDLLRPRADRRGAVPRRRSSTRRSSIRRGGGCRGRMGTGIDPEDVLEPYGADATRYGLLKVTSSQDPRFSFGTIEEGRKLANKLWNASRLLLHGRRRRAGGAAVVGRGALDPRADRRDPRRARGRPRRLRLRARRRAAVPPHVRRLLRLVPRVDQAAARGGGRARDGVRGARAAPQAAPSGDAARDRGDLDEPAGARDAADRRAVAGAADRVRGRPRTRSTRRRRRRASTGAAASGSRSAATRCGSSRRSSVPRTTGRATSRPSARGSQKEIERGREDAREREVRRERRARGRRGRAARSSRNTVAERDALG